MLRSEGEAISQSVAGITLDPGQPDSTLQDLCTEAGGQLPWTQGAEANELKLK